MYHHKPLPTRGTCTYYHKVPARKPQSQLCQHQSTLRTGQTLTTSHKLTNHSQWQSTSRKGTTPPHGNGLLADQASIQPGQHNTRTTSQSRSHERKVQLPLHENKSNNCGDQPTPHLQTHNCRSMPSTFRDSGLSSLK
ncbi:hypothetical protein Taro_050084 [Colocasia esculenta]|uniref:Uncharacterized protein n=1 Tax=Colocasia esculenta TaxID=4460 RepID=A0A843XD32_COLES|nr:hypothetical protein [Colocasia esculenta]